MDLDMEEVRKTALDIIVKVVKERKLAYVTATAHHDAPKTDCMEEQVANRPHRENTPRVIRRKVEDAMGLEENALDEKEYKDAVKEVVQDYIVRRSYFVNECAQFGHSTFL